MTTIRKNKNKSKLKKIYIGAKKISKYCRFQGRKGAKKRRDRCHILPATYSLQIYNRESGNPNAVFHQLYDHQAKLSYFSLPYYIFSSTANYLLKFISDNQTGSSPNRKVQRSLLSLSSLP